MEYDRRVALVNLTRQEELHFCSFLDFSEVEYTVQVLEDLSSHITWRAVFVGTANQGTVEYETYIHTLNEQPFILLDHRAKAFSHNVVGVLSTSDTLFTLFRLLRNCDKLISVLSSRTHDLSDVLASQLVGVSDNIEKVRSLIALAASSSANVMILGASGTGKEVAAQLIHKTSQRHNEPFIAVNCGAIPSELLESELFGHEKGAFTGALHTRKGRFELADKGTLFLDEIGDMPTQMQVKLLRVLQEMRFERVGGIKPIRVNVRIIAATHRNLEQLIQSGSFREDLFYRLQVFPIEMPSLKDRVVDVPLLAQFIINKLIEKGCSPIRLSQCALNALKVCSWPGNVRELSNLVERLMVLYPNSEITASDLPYKYVYHLPDMSDSKLAMESDNKIINRDSEVTCESDALFGHNILFDLSENGVDLKETLSNIEVNLIQAALDKNQGVVSRAAMLLKIRRTTLVEKMRKYDIQVSNMKDKEALELEV